jgi:hypothetical protein
MLRGFSCGRSYLPLEQTNKKNCNTMNTEATEWPLPGAPPFTCDSHWGTRSLRPGPNAKAKSIRPAGEALKTADDVLAADYVADGLDRLLAWHVEQCEA